jgi:chromosome segregation ATPase
LQIILENKTTEISHLRTQLGEFVQSNGQILEEKTALERMVQDLREAKFRNKNEIDRVLDDNQRLSRNCKEEEVIIKNLELERNKYLEINEELKYDNSNLQSKIRQRDDNLNYYQKQLEDSNKTISRMNNTIKELELQADRLHNELEIQTTTNQKEIRLRLEREKLYEDVEGVMKDKEREIKKLLNELDNYTVQKEKLYEDNTKMYNEIDKLKNHIYVLTEQYQNVKINL